MLAFLVLIVGIIALVGFMKALNEISKKLDIPIGTVKSRLYNAKQILAEELSDLL